MTVLNSIRKLLGLRVEPPPRLPEIGDIWVYRSEGPGPWPSKNDRSHSVTVVDVKDGWVRYKWNRAMLWQDERTTISSFIAWYEFESTVAWEKLKPKSEYLPEPEAAIE